MFPERLKALRLEAGLTQKQVAEKLNMTQQGYQSWEKGKSKPGEKTLKKFATFYNVPIDYLLGNTDIKKTGDDITETELDNILDQETLSFDGKEIPEEDRKMLKQVIRDYLNGTLK